MVPSRQNVMGDNRASEVSLIGDSAAQESLTYHRPPAISIIGDIWVHVAPQEREGPTFRLLRQQ
jgi:hypothetical protein